MIRQNPPPPIPAKRPNDTFQNAMPLPTPPVSIVTTFDNDRPQLFSFPARRGEIWTFLVPANKDMDTDIVVKLRDSRKIIRAVAVGPAKKDRRLVFKIPADGLYFVELSDAQTRSGPKFACVLVVRHENSPATP